MRSVYNENWARILVCAFNELYHSKSSHPPSQRRRSHTASAPQPASALPRAPPARAPHRSSLHLRHPPKPGPCFLYRRAVSQPRCSAVQAAAASARAGRATPPRRQPARARRPEPFKFRRRYSRQPQRPLGHCMSIPSILHDWRPPRCPGGGQGGRQPLPHGSARRAPRQSLANELR